MLRRALMEKQGEVDSEGFRLRGTEISRIEGLADGVFALAVTLLIFSAEVPRTFTELHEAIKGLPVFAVCMGTIMWYWYEHYVFSRRYGLSDKATITLTSVLLMVILFAAYPLKFLFTLVIRGLIFRNIRDSGGVPMIVDEQIPELFLLFGIGFGGIALVFLLLHRHALSQRERLALTPVEVVLTQAEIAKSFAMMCIATTSIIGAYLLPINFIGIAGVWYAMTGICEWRLSVIYGRKVSRMRREMGEGADSAPG